MIRILAPTLAVALIAGAAWAKADPPNTSTSDPGHTISGVTVEGRKIPGTSCHEHDKACISTVVAELKARYPKQLQQWCDHVDERAAMNDLFFDRGPDGSQDGHPHSNFVPYRPPEIAKVACTGIPKTK